VKFGGLLDEKKLCAVFDHHSGFVRQGHAKFSMANALNLILGLKSTASGIRLRYQQTPWIES
jgi:hypothetical protein